MLEDSSTFYLDDNSHAQIIDVEFEQVEEEETTEDSEEEEVNDDKQD